MAITRRDIAASLFTAAAVGTYIAYLQGTNVTLISSVRGTAVVVLVLGALGCAFSDATELSRGTTAGGYRAVMTLVGSITGIAAVLAIILGNGVLLTILVTGVALMWLAATLRHASTVVSTKPANFTAPRS